MPIYMSRPSSLSLVSDNKQIESRRLGSIAICTYSDQEMLGEQRAECIRS